MIKFHYQFDKFLVGQYKIKLTNLLLLSLFIKYNKNNKNITSVNFVTRTESDLSQNSSFDLEEYEKKVNETNLI